MYVCVYIYVYIHACPTRTPSHACIKRRTSRTHSQTRKFVGTCACIYTRHPVRYDTTAICLNKIHAKNCILAQTR